MGEQTWLTITQGEKKCVTGQLSRLTKTFNFGFKRPLNRENHTERGLLTMEGNVQQQKTTPLARELTRTFNSYNKHTIQLKKNLKETNAFFREIRQNYSNVCASTVSSDSASFEAGRFEHMSLRRVSRVPGCTSVCLKEKLWRFCCQDIASEQIDKQHVFIPVFERTKGIKPPSEKHE